MKNRNAARRVRSRSAPLGLILALAIAMALVVGGCGGSSSSSGSSSEETDASSTSAAGAGAQQPGGFELSEEAQACLEESGVELPEVGQGGGPPAGAEGGEPPQGLGGDQAKLKQALQDCGVEIPAGQGPAGGAQTNSAGFRKAIKEYVACVRENGYDLPEPNLSGNGPVFDESEVDQEDPEFKKASEECQSLLGPQGGGGSE